MLAVVVLPGIGSCSDDEQVLQPEMASQASIVLVSPVGGFGDNGYNDLILQGVLQYAHQHDLEVSLVQSRTTGEARAALRALHGMERSESFILLLADEQYTDVARAECGNLPTECSVLLFEVGEDVPGIASFCIDRYGVSYLAGRMARGSAQALVAKACPGNPMIEEAARGFCDGYADGRPDGSLCQLYLSDTSAGYDMADSTYRLASAWQGAFVYPLAGGSNMGFYRYSRDNYTEGILVAGMDTDCQMLSQRVPFSVVYHIDKAIQDLLDEWQSAGKLDGHRSFGLAEGYADIVLSSRFYTAGHNVWEDYYVQPDYWETLYNRYRAEAERKEAEQHED